MSAEILRRAADRMRQQAERMPKPKRRYGMESKWTSSSTMLSRVYAPDNRVLMESRQNHAPYDGVYAADYFSSWHPAVALAVADWLDAVAGDWSIAVHGYWSVRALAGARAYLGEDA